MGMIWNTLKGLKTFLKSVLSEPDGTPSSTRSLMFVFSMFSLWLLWRIFWHVFHLHDTAQLTIWLSNIPLLITALMGLIALPYTINKGAGAVSETFSGLANMMASSRQVQLNASLENKIGDYIQKMNGNNGNPAPQATVTTTATNTVTNAPLTPGTGSSGPKG